MHRLVLIHEALHAEAGCLLRLLAERLEDRLQVLDLLFGLGLVLLERGLELGVLRFLVFAGRFTAAVLMVFLARLLAGWPGKA